MKMNATCRSITLESSFVTLLIPLSTQPLKQSLSIFCHYSVAFPLLKFPINAIIRGVMSCVCLHSLSLMLLRFTHVVARKGCAILFIAQEYCIVLVYG